MLEIDQNDPYDLVMKAAELFAEKDKFISKFEMGEFSEAVRGKAFYLLSQITRLRQEQLIEVFDNILGYKIYKIKKRSGGFRTLSEPHETVKLVQQIIMKNFLYRIVKRGDFYRRRYAHRGWVYYKKAFDHNIAREIYGMIPHRSIKQSANVHCNNNSNYILKLDLKDAFGSINKDVVRDNLFNVVYCDCKTSFYTCKQRYIFRNRSDILKSAISALGIPSSYDFMQLEFMEYTDPEKWKSTTKSIKEWDNSAETWLRENGYNELITPGYLRSLISTFVRRNGAWFFMYSIGRRSFPKYSFFPKYRFPEFRKHILEEACKQKNIEDTDIPDVIRCLCEYISVLCSYNGSLPQGAPTSGFLLNLVISETAILNKIKRIKEVDNVSIYVDDIIISTQKKPSAEFINVITRKISETGFLKHNQKKTKVYDLKKTSASILGIKIVKRLPNEIEMKELIRETSGGKPEIRGFKKAISKGRPWQVMKVSLSKEKQKQYRAYFHQINSMDSEEVNLLISKALGYYGHIMSIYGYPIDNLPSALKVPVREFRTKYIKEKAV